MRGEEGVLQRAFINFFTMKPVFPPAPVFDYSSEGASKNKLTSWAIAISFLVSYIGITFVGVVILWALLLFFGFGEGMAFSIADIVVQIFLIPIVLVFIYLDGNISRTKELLRFGPPRRALTMILAIPLVVMIIDSISVLIYSIIFITLFGEPATNTDIGTTWDSSNMAIFLAFLSICIMTPISEELFFRGYLLDSINRIHGKWPAIVISSLLFGLVHIDPFAIGLATIGGVIYGWIRIRTGSLVPVIVAHAMWNTMALMVTYL